ncbi:ORF4 [Yacon necrotic mottle virus]|uniref:ORF4 n=1 Tax=Yacon necrotic mottle virus TaxID=1561150 RepID=A0A0C4MZL5_9VIRU|nr:ORF4 [Yacon necrotic mottle virus]AIT58610.1 ORF4 [Yacon necrotic mottle virus]
MYRTRDRSPGEGSSSDGGNIRRKCEVKQREEWLRRNNPDFQLLPKIYRGQFSFEEPGALYRHYQIRANTTPIRLEESSIYAGVAQQYEREAAKQAVRTMRHLQAVLDFKAQVCLAKSSADNYWGDHWPNVKKQNQQARKLLSELEALCIELGQVPI